MRITSPNGSSLLGIISNLDLNNGTAEIIYEDKPHNNQRKLMRLSSISKISFEGFSGKLDDGLIRVLRVNKPSFRFDNILNGESSNQKNVFDNKRRSKVDDQNPYYVYNNLMIEEEDKMNFEKLQYHEKNSFMKMDVFVKIDKFTKCETDSQEIKTIAIPDTQSIVVFNPLKKINGEKIVIPVEYKFDTIFHEDVNNEHVYKGSCQQLLYNFFDGGSATCFVHGFTTYDLSNLIYGDKKMNNGLITLMARDIFNLMNNNSINKMGYSIAFTSYDIHMDKLYDLLQDGREIVFKENDSSKPMQLKPIYCKNYYEAVRLIFKALEVKNKASQTVFQFLLIKNRKIVSKLNIVDLVEIINVHRNKKRHKKDNSLIVLKECFNKMTVTSFEKFPFQNSTLTRCLRDAFIGDKSKICVISTISPAISQCDLIMRTLRYSEQLMYIKKRLILSTFENKSMFILKDGIKNTDVDEHAFEYQSKDEGNEFLKIEHLTSNLRTLKDILGNTISDIDTIEALLHHKKTYLAKLQFLKFQETCELNSAIKLVYEI
uniref:Kinesin motor domain-containing protein n=1 Tax=Parastrongyloides trichosuri TaxID=131310 RepID=A0A0N4Z4N2_PARTI